MIDKEKLYQEAIRKWGFSSQLNMMIEECSELITAIQKLKRRETFGIDNRCVEQIMEETADVDIMCEQFKIMFDSDKILEYKFKKLRRLKKRLEND